MHIARFDIYRSVIFTAICLAAVSLAMDVGRSQTSRRVAFRVVSGKTNLYYTSGCSNSTDSAARVTINQRPSKDSLELGENQVFELIDINGDSLDWGDEVRIKRCDNNYLRVNSGGGLDSVPPLKGDDPPDSDEATVFTVEKPDVELPKEPGFYLFLKSKRSGKFLEAPYQTETNGEGLNVMSRDSNLPNRFVLELIDNPSVAPSRVGAGSAGGTEVSAARTETVCAGTTRPGWIVYTDAHDSTRCNPVVGDPTIRNVVTLVQYDGLHIGATLSVCNRSDNIPKGWSKVSTSKDSSRCGGAQVVGDNVATIRRDK